MTPELALSIITKVDALLDDLYQIRDDEAGISAITDLGAAMGTLIGAYPEVAEAVRVRIETGGYRDGS